MGEGETSKNVLDYPRIRMFGMIKSYEAPFKRDKCNANVKIILRRTC